MQLRILRFWYHFISWFLMAFNIILLSITTWMIFYQPTNMFSYLIIITIMFIVSLIMGLISDKIEQNYKAKRDERLTYKV